MGAWAQGRSLASATMLLFCLTAPLRLCAQTLDTIPKPRVSALIHYGKWVTLGGAAALGVVAHARNQDAERTYQALQDRCAGLPARAAGGDDR